MIDLFGSSFAFPSLRNGPHFQQLLRGCFVRYRDPRRCSAPSVRKFLYSEQRGLTDSLTVKTTCFPMLLTRASQTRVTPALWGTTLVASPILPLMATASNHPTHTLSIQLRTSKASLPNMLVPNSRFNKMIR